MSTAQSYADTGVIHGRFQILHNDHMCYLLSARELCRHLVVGITNPDPVLTRSEPFDTHRSSAESNPLSYYERFLTIRAALEDAGLRAEEYSIVPFPISFPDLYACYLPMDALFFVSIYDDWGREKLRRFQALGLRTHVLRSVAPEDKGISSTDIRRLIGRNEPWEHLVPPTVVRILKQSGVIERIRSDRQPETG